MLFVSIALAHSLAPFTGTWHLDPEASTSLDALLSAQGLSWPLRKLAGTARPTLEVRETDGGLAITTLDPLGRREDLVHPDGQARETTTRQGPVTCTSRWAGAALLTRCRLAEGELVVERRVADDVWTQDLAFTPTGGPRQTARRVFRRTD
jgi:hypothetical protein